MCRMEYTIYHLTNGTTYTGNDLKHACEGHFVVIGKKVRKLYREVSYLKHDGNREERIKARYYLGTIKEEEVGYYDSYD